MIEMYRRPLWVVGAALSIGAGVIHLALGPEHLIELGTLGYGFYVSGILQVAWAVALLGAIAMPLRRDSRRVLKGLAWSGIATNVAILAAWAFSRVFGLPAGETPWTPEAIGPPDAIAGILESVLVLGLAGSLRGWTTDRVSSTRLLGITAAIALSAIMLGTVVAIAPDMAGHAEGHEQAAAELGAGNADHAAGHAQAMAATGTTVEANASR